MIALNRLTGHSPGFFSVYTLPPNQAVSVKAQKRINQTLEVWENLRPKKSFAGMTLAQFKAILKPSLDSRAEITNLRNQLKGTIRDRIAADIQSVDACFRVVNAVRADVDEGENGAVYKALGYVTKSDRRSGLHRLVPTPLKKAA